LIGPQMTQLIDAGFSTKLNSIERRAWKETSLETFYVIKWKITLKFCTS